MSGDGLEVDLGRGLGERAARPCGDPRPRWPPRSSASSMGRAWSTTKRRRLASCGPGRGATVAHSIPSQEHGAVDRAGSEAERGRPGVTVAKRLRSAWESSDVVVLGEEPRRARACRGRAGVRRAGRTARGRARRGRPGAAAAVARRPRRSPVNRDHAATSATVAGPNAREVAEHRPRRSTARSASGRPSQDSAVVERDLRRLRPTRPRGGTCTSGRRFRQA